jgi:DNA alkylation repair enzyme
MVKPIQTKTKAKASRQGADVSAAQFIKTLKSYRSAEEIKKIERTLKVEEESSFIGVSMGQVFALAKEFIAMPLGDIEELLESKIHEVRVGAVSIMDFQARGRSSQRIAP